MLSSDETRAGGKPNPRKGKPAQMNKKGEQRNRKTARPLETKPDQAQDTQEEMRAEAMSAPVITATDPAAAPASTETVLASSPEPAEAASVSYRSIADAWGNYSRTSLEQTRSYFEKLAGVRSLGAALEVQAEFAKQACDTFVAQSQKIGALQGELAKQRLKRLQGFMEKMTAGGRRS